MNYDSAEVKSKSKKEKLPTLFIELFDQRDSGWILDGTESTNKPVKLTAPSAEFIPNRGFRLVKGNNPATGQAEWFNEEIRYIKNQRELSVEQQKIKGIYPSKNKLEDKIIVKGGNFSVTREGSFIGLYDYLLCVFYNSTNPNRPSSAKKIYKVVEVGKNEEEFNEQEIAIADAIQYLGTMRVKKANGFVYDEQRIDALCQLFVVFADSPAGKLSGLVAWAKKDPVDFLNKALKLEQTVQTEIAYALEMSVIKFDGNTLVYCAKDKVICDIGRGNLKHETKIAKAGEFLTAPENKEAYDELIIELNAAQERKS